ncbi:DUF4259 domain-containing protein [Pseudonocardia sp. TRM90224]|uniref:DUF4259 domain-containing protein n=1 Tax=Pseudonocardia sp. TRM90224 TaxID=2812678 RepID=UPI001E6518B2|nr:DUF4259 domain-containing protein [Pseudonocardia sp. TRM90224]
MGTWGFGPFDNDTAADWAGDLHEAAQAERVKVVRATLERAAGAHGDVEYSTAVEAIAAAAVVAIHSPGGEKFVSIYGPDFVEAGERLDLPDGMLVLALRALDRATSAESHSTELWAEAGLLAEAMAAMKSLYDLLEYGGAVHPDAGEQLALFDDGSVG